MLGLIGRKADGWVPSLSYSPPDRLPEMHRRIDEGAAEAGRDPSEIKRVYNVAGTIGPEGEGPLEGPPQKWVETLTGFILEDGMDSFVFWPGGDHERQAELFAAEVVPGVREAVGAARS
jgi:hypothetical protein